MNHKTCARCGKTKTLSEFHRNTRNRDGLHSYCKDCNKKAAAKFLKTEKGKAGIARYFKTEKGKAILRRGVEKKRDKGYYRYGKGAIPILRQGARKRDIPFNLRKPGTDPVFIALCFCL